MTICCNGTPLYVRISLKNSPYVTGIYYGGHERTWCKYILTRYSDILSSYSGLLSRHGDLHVVKSLYIGPYSNLLS